MLLGHMVSVHVGGLIVCGMLCVCLGVQCARMCVWEPEADIRSSFTILHFLTEAVFLNKPRTC